MARLSALVVNFNSGAFAVRCVDSLRRVWALEGRDPEDLEVVVVDNASPQDQDAALAELERGGAHVVRSPDNLGYGRGMNLALAHSRGGPDDVVAVLNPDLLFLPGSVKALMEDVRPARVGVVDATASIVPGGDLVMPRNILPTPANHVRVLLAQRSAAWARAYGRWRVRLSLPWWTSSGSVEADMLAGCCLFLRRAVIDELGELFDERFQLYYEDTDLFTRLRRRGYRLLHVGRARIVHHWSRSAVPGGAAGGAILAWSEESRRAYFRKHHGALGWWFVRATSWLAERWSREQPGPMHEQVDLGERTEPVEIRLPRPGRFLLEMASQPNFLLTCAVVGEGDRWVCPPDTWSWLFQVRYFVRVLDLANNDVIGAWTFHKTTPGRAEPLSAAELDELFAAHAAGVAAGPVGPPVERPVERLGERLGERSGSDSNDAFGTAEGSAPTAAPSSARARGAEAPDPEAPETEDVV